MAAPIAAVLVNYHNTHPTQRYALDRYDIFGTTVYSPCDAGRGVCFSRLLLALLLGVNGGSMYQGAVQEASWTGEKQSAC